MSAVSRFALAFVAGVVGAASMSALTALARRQHVPIDFESMLGTLAGGAPTTARRRVGLAVQLANGGLLAQPYALVLEKAPASGWVIGAALGLLHAMAAGIVLAAVPALHPEVPGRLPEPGAFYARQGLAASIVFVAAHVLYGTIVGIACGTARQRLVRP